MNKKIAGILIGIIFCSLPIKGQELDLSTYTQTHKLLYDSNSSLVQYGNIPVSHYTGAVNYEIPIYHIKDKDFDLPITLLYVSDGFKPQRQAGIAGLNWNLKAGGFIAREVHGNRDDRPDEGFYESAKKYKFKKEDIWSDYPEMSNNKNVVIKRDNKYDLNTKDPFHDWMPDYFWFSFCGYNGQFIIDNEGNIKTDIKGYKIDLEKMVSDQEVKSSSNKSQITITTPNGYMYEFGGVAKSLDIFEGYFGKETAIITWNLSKIISPNGRMLKINYFDTDDEMWVNNLGTNCKISIIKSIEIEDTGLKIEFNRSLEPQELYKEKKLLYKIDKIQVKLNHKTVFTYDFEYEYYDYRRFLKSFSQNKSYKYKFYYNHPYRNYPESIADTYGVGYAGKEKSLYGTLQKIEYPTGGYTTFSFENHTCKYVKEFLWLDKIQHIISTLDTDSVLDGIRIKKIEDYSLTNELSSSKEYYYTEKNDVGSGYSLYSGTAAMFVEYISKLRYVIGSRELSLDMWSAYYNILEPDVAYSSVIEKLDSQF